MVWIQIERISLAQAFYTQVKVANLAVCCVWNQIMIHRYDITLKIVAHSLMVRQMIRLTIRATDDSVPKILLKLMEERLAAGDNKFTEPAETLTHRDISDTFSNVLVA